MKHSLAITAVLFTVGFVSIPVVFSDSDFRWREYEQKYNGVANVSNPTYTEECGSCHLAYPPGLLPTRSWAKMMNSLDDHFGDNAELDADTRGKIIEFLVSNSADHSNYRRSRKIDASVPRDAAPLRITETPYFRHEHDEIPTRLVKGNDQVNSFSQCNSCHGKAEQGSFNEDDIRIPGYGRWDD